MHSENSVSGCLVVEATRFVGSLPSGRLPCMSPFEKSNAVAQTRLHYQQLQQKTCIWQITHLGSSYHILNRHCALALRAYLGVLASLGPRPRDPWVEEYASFPGVTPLLVASLFLVVRSGATTSVLAPSSDALCY